MLRSVFSNWFGLLAIGLMAFLITPFMIHRLGDFQFGIYTLAFSAVGYFEVLTQCIRSTLQRYTGRLSDEQSREALNSVFSTALTLTLIGCALIIALFFGLAGILPSFFKLGSTQRHLFSQLVILLGLNLGTSIPVALLGSYLCGLHRFDLYNCLEIIRHGVRALLIVVVLLHGDGVLAVAGCVLVSTLMCVPLNWWMIRRIDPGLRLSRKLVHLGTAGELLTFSFWTMLNNVGSLLRDSTDSMVIGRVLATALITPFAVASRLVAYFRPIITSIVSPILPRISQLDSQGRHDEVRRVFINMTRLSALASMAIGSILLLNGRSVLLLWVGPRYVSSYSILVLLTIGAVSSAAQLGTLQTLVGLGRHRPYGIWTIGEGLTNLLLSIIWAHKYGLIGVAWGTAVPLLAVKLTLQPWYITRVLHMSLWEYFRKALARPLIACAIFAAICVPISRLQAIGNMWHFLATISWEGILLLILAYLVGLNASDKEMVQLRFRSLARLASSPR